MNFQITLSPTPKADHLTTIFGDNTYMLLDDKSQDKPGELCYESQEHIWHISLFRDHDNVPSNTRAVMLYANHLL